MRQAKIGPKFVGGNRCVFPSLVILGHARDLGCRSQALFPQMPYQFLLRGIVEEFHCRSMLSLFKFRHAFVGVGVRFSFVLAAELDQKSGMSFRHEVHVWHRQALLFHVAEDSIVEGFQRDRAKLGGLDNMIGRRKDIGITGHQ